MISVIKKFSLIFDSKQKKKIVVLFVLMLIGAALETIGVSLMLPLMTAVMQPDIIETNKTVAAVCSFFDLHSYRTFVILCIGALIFVYVVKDLFLIFQYNMQYRFTYNNRFLTQRRLLHSYMEKDYEFFLHASSGQILQVVQNNVTTTFGLFTTLLSLATESIVSLALVVTVFVVSPVMTIFIAASMAVSMFFIVKVVKPIMKREGVSFQKNSAKSNTWLMQAIQGIKEVKVTNTEGYFEENYDQVGRKVIQSQKSESVINNVPRLIIEMTCVCSVLLVIAIMIFMGTDMNEIVPSLGVFAMAAVKLMPSANRIVNAMNAISYQVPALDLLLENMSDVQQMGEITYQDKNHASCLELQNVTMRDISYHYPSSKEWIFEHAELSIEEGQSVGIVGASGAGKTTLVDILLGLLKPTSGEILVNGTDIHSVYSNWLATIGYIPQTIFMLDGGVRANVAFGEKPEDIDEERVWNALRAAQMEDFVKGMSEGLDTRIGERGIRLSGGQRQRIGIARALYREPKLLIFDEATSALDNDTEAAIMEAINTFKGEKTMIIIAHRLTTIENCDHIYRVKDGKILQER